MSSSIETIYKYTEALIKEQNSSLARLDTKSTVLIAFAGTIAKITIDINSSNHTVILFCGQNIVIILSICIYIFSGLTVFLASLGITARPKGLTVDPEVLMSDEWFDRDEDIQKGFIISGWIATMKEYQELAKRKAFRLNLTVFFLNLALISLILIAILILWKWEKSVDLVEILSGWFG